MFDFKGLIDAVLRRAYDGSAAGPSPTRMMAEMPRDETLGALAEIVKACAALNRNSRVGLKERYRAVQAFDDKARPLVEVLLGVHQGRDRIEGIAPRQIIPTLLACWQELASAYKLCLKQHAQQPAARFAADAELITLRAMAYYAELARWAYLRYFEPEARIWRNLNRLYLIADSAGFANKDLRRYPDESPSRISSHYLRIAMLKLAEPERRRPEDLRYLDQLFPACLPYLRIEQIIRIREQSHAVNLDDVHPPRRLRRNMVGERYRYLDTEALASHLKHLAEQQPQTGQTPVEQALRQQLLLDVAQGLGRTHAARSRRNERRNREQSSSVALGLARISRALRQGADGADWESWTLADESSSGLGAHYHARADDRLSVGEILVLRQDNRLSLHVVRRLQKSRDGQVRVGAERISHSVQLVSLRDQQGGAAALYCADSAQGGRLLVIDSAHYQEGQEMILSAGRKQFRIRTGAALARLPNYVLSPFSVLAAHPPTVPVAPN